MATPTELSKDGYELQFATNHLGHALLMKTWAATAKKGNQVNGAYYEPVSFETVPSTRQGKDRALAKKLWEWTEKELNDWN
ncbi:hypothetical protein P3342_005182 [Pyrenophora teres f. teres]|nr:hypothetical protein P3342_005182 [Pyrenophora teres f. teres]